MPIKTKQLKTYNKYRAIIGWMLSPILMMEPLSSFVAGCILSIFTAVVAGLLTTERRNK